jgi:hypothetical protein
MPLDRERQIDELIVSYGRRFAESASETFPSIPLGWLRAVRCMLDQVEQILTEAEQASFRWTAVGKQQGTLVVQWSGAGDSRDLIAQIVEGAIGEAAKTCIECGASSLIGLQNPEGPHCLSHLAMEPGSSRINGWNLLALELVRLVQGRIGMVLPANLIPKTMAAALPLLIREATAYFSKPDQDAKAIAQQLREAIQRLDQQLRAFTNTNAQLKDH